MAKFLYCLLAVTAIVSMLVTSCKKSSEATKTTATVNPLIPTGGVCIAQFNSGKSYGTLTDVEGNTYKTITIGTQTWMAQNLRTSHYRNGEAVAMVNDYSKWVTLTTGAYCSFNYTKNVDSLATNGRLYNWYAVTESRNIAPAGWHIPSVNEWELLITNLGGDVVAGNPLKEQGTAHWTSPISGTTNESGFTALPSGYLSYTAFFQDFGMVAEWWASTSITIFGLQSSNSAIYNYNGHEYSGHSVRCVKD